MGHGGTVDGCFTASTSGVIAVGSRSAVAGVSLAGWPRRRIKGIVLAVHGQGEK